MKITPDSSLSDVAFIVCTALDQAGVTAVLTGGSAATIWSQGIYQSHDCDFVVSFAKSDQTGREAIAALGFEESGGIYRHPHSVFTADFLRGPLSVGDEIISSWTTLQSKNMKLHILSATDSCRDRLAAFFHWNDFSSLKVAVQIARHNELDWHTVKAWSYKENMSSKFQQFELACKLS